MVGQPDEIADDAIVHRVGGAAVGNLRPSALDTQQSPPGISVLLGGTAREAATQMRSAFPRSRKWQVSARLVGTSSAGAIRAAGFEIVPDPTSRFPNHARLIHPGGLAGFSDENLEILARAFQETTGC